MRVSRDAVPCPCPEAPLTPTPKLLTSNWFGSLGPQGSHHGMLGNTAPSNYQVDMP
jgi:hypothetical protein